MKHPKLKVRYARGLGDIIACFLHSRLVGWLTHIITGQDKPCVTCSQRANALNFLFPVPVWKLFFKDNNQYVESITKELKLYQDFLNLPILDSIKTDSIKENSVDKNIEKPKIEQANGYTLISSSDNPLGEYLVRVQIFKTNGNRNN